MHPRGNDGTLSGDMSATKPIFYTANVEQLVPGPPADIAALAYNLQYTTPLVDALVARNPPAGRDFHVVRVGDRELVRANFTGVDPDDPSRRISAIGIGDTEANAGVAATRAWFDFHASVLFSGMLGDGESAKLNVGHRVPGVPSQRTATVGVAYELPYMASTVKAAVARNMPTNDEVHVMQAGDLTLMRVNLFGRDPLDSSRGVCVSGVADRHYRAMAAAEQAWSDYHGSLLFAANALGAG